MRLRSLLLASLLYHWRANIAVVLGVMVGTAVLTGALLVGDSLRGSLNDLTLNRLGPIDDALVSDRFFPASLAARLRGSDEARNLATTIILRGTVVRLDASGGVCGRAGNVQIIGADDALFRLF